MSMMPQHWVMLIVVLALGYWLGARYPMSVPLIGKS